MSGAAASIHRTPRAYRLVPLAEDHLEHEMDLDSDPEVMRYLGNGKVATREQVVQAHQERLAVGDLVPGLGFWAGTGVRGLPARAPASCSGMGSKTWGCRGYSPRPWPSTSPPAGQWRQSACSTPAPSKGTSTSPFLGTEHGEVEYAITRKQWSGRG
jgi:hypothetical protein